ncbi:MAG: TadE family protein [Pirellulales bacterium]
MQPAVDQKQSRTRTRTSRRGSQGSSFNRRARGGAVILEVILALPLLAIVLMAVVEFGIMLSNLQHLEFASRTGAQVAAELDQADFYDSGSPWVPPQVLAAVDSQLAQTSIGGSPLTAARVYLEHTIPPAGPGVTGSVVRVCGGPSPSPCTGADVVDASVSSAYRYVRVTVFVDATSATPNLLASFGFDLVGSQFQQTTTFAYLR